MNGNRLSEQVPLVKGPFNDFLEITSSKNFKQLLWILNLIRKYLFFFLILIALSMVNCITLDPTSRVALASCRNAFTMVISCTSLGSYFTFFLLHVFLSVKSVYFHDKWFDEY
ncbi:hypothetical protein BHE74_00033806 [Ensete ventricosum]|nr:hypothetical protein BHE74_00033806 [Ensete ventricosum]